MGGLVLPIALLIVGVILVVSGIVDYIRERRLPNNVVSIYDKRK